MGKLAVIYKPTITRHEYQALAKLFWDRGYFGGRYKANSLNENEMRVYKLMKKIRSARERLDGQK